MKKIFLILVASFLLFASQIDTERKIYDTIFHIVLPHKRPIHVWSDSEAMENMLRSLDDVVVVKKIDQADIAIITKESVKDCRCLLFVTSYRLLKRYKEKAIGGFFWQKGRPNLLFLRKNLQKEGIELPESMQQFVEDSL